MYLDDERRRNRTCCPDGARRTGGPALCARGGRRSRARIARAVRTLLGLFDKHVGTHSSARIVAIVVVYAVELAGMFWAAYGLRWDFAVPSEFERQCLTLILPVVACKLLLLQSFGQFRSIMSYFGLTDFGGVVLSMSIVSGMMLALLELAPPSRASRPPRGSSSWILS